SPSPTLPLITWFFAALAVLSLLFAFGTPLYALLFYGLPGWSQLHSPFRWVFPFTLSMAALGAIGLNVVLAWMERGARREAQEGDKQRGRQGEGESPISQSPISNLPISQWLAALLAFAGLGALLAVLASVLAPGPFVAFGQRVVDGSDLAQM